MFGIFVRAIISEYVLHNLWSNPILVGQMACQKRFMSPSALLYTFAQGVQDWRSCRCASCRAVGQGVGCHKFKLRTTVLLFARNHQSLLPVEAWWSRNLNPRLQTHAVYHVGSTAQAPGWLPRIGLATYWHVCITRFAHHAHYVFCLERFRWALYAFVVCIMCMPCACAVTIQHNTHTSYIHPDTVACFWCVLFVGLFSRVAYSTC